MKHLLIAIVVALSLVGCRGNEYKEDRVIFKSPSVCEEEEGFCTFHIAETENGQLAIVCKKCGDVVAPVWKKEKED